MTKIIECEHYILFIRNNDIENTVNSIYFSSAQYMLKRVCELSREYEREGKPLFVTLTMIIFI